ncbi:MAG: hypothetical protein WDN24_01335 [Sphingomonas sp.]
MLDWITPLVFLLAGATLALLIWNARRNGDPRLRGAGAIALASAIPPLLAFLCVGAGAYQGRFGDVRLLLTGFQGSIAAAAAPGGTSPCTEREGMRVGFRAGGEADCDDLVIANAVPGALRIGQAPNDPRLTLLPLPLPDAWSAQGPYSATLVAVGEQSNLRVLGARGIAAGDSFCLARCGDPASWIEFTGTGIILAKRESVFQLRPLFWALRDLIDSRRISNPSRWGPVSAVYPLRHYLPQIARPASGTPECLRFACVRRGKRHSGAGAQLPVPVGRAERRRLAYRAPRSRRATPSGQRSRRRSRRRARDRSRQDARHHPRARAVRRPDAHRERGCCGRFAASMSRTFTGGNCRTLASSSRPDRRASPCAW